MALDLRAVSGWGRVTKHDKTREDLCSRECSTSYHLA